MLDSLSYENSLSYEKELTLVMELDVWMGDLWLCNFHKQEAESKVPKLMEIRYFS